MNNEDPRQKPERLKDANGYENPPDATPRREGGDDALAEIHPTDSRADEKVIVNEQRDQKVVNTPSQTGAHTSETEGTESDVDAV